MIEIERSPRTRDTDRNKEKSERRISVLRREREKAERGIQRLSERKKAAREDKRH